MARYFFNGVLFTTTLFRAYTSKFGDAIQSGTHRYMHMPLVTTVLKVHNRQQVAAKGW
jgi:hypothetical protein